MELGICEQTPVVLQTYEPGLSERTEVGEAEIDILKECKKVEDTQPPPAAAGGRTGRPFVPVYTGNEVFYSQKASIQSPVIKGDTDSFAEAVRDPR